MNRSINKKPSLDDYDEEYKEIMEKEKPSAGEMIELIESILESKPFLMSKHYKVMINNLIDEFNSNYGDIYKRVK